MTLAVDPVLSLLAIAAIALLFASAAVAKLRDLPRFASVLAAYEVMPAAMARIAAVWLPFIELAIAIGLCVTQVRFIAAVAAAGLLFIYGAAIALNLVRGRRDIDCGCEGFGKRRPIAGWMLARNALLIGVVALAVAPAASRPLSLTDALTVAAGLAVFVLLYFAAVQLLSPRRIA